MAIWKRVLFVVVLVIFIGLSVFFTFYAIARDTYEFEEQENVGDIEDLDGWVFYGFSGNTSTVTVNIDYVRDENGENPDTSKPIVGVDDFTIVSDEYVEFITIGKDVQYISEQAFYYCKMLKAVYVDEENQWYTSVDGVLYTKDMKTLVLHPICNSQWLVDEGLADTADTYDIPEGVETVGGYSFYKNLDLVHLTFSSTVTSIGDMAFFGCNNMWSIWLPEGLETIGADAFSYCWSISPIIYIPASVTTIGHHAFYSCSSITVVYMGASSEEDYTAGDNWLPKSISKAIVNVAPDPVYGMTLEDAIEEKERLDNESAEEA